MRGEKSWYENSSNPVWQKAWLFKQPHPPGIQSSYSKCTPQDSPVSVQQYGTQLDTKPLHLRETLSFERGGISPGTRTLQNAVWHKAWLFRQLHPLQFNLITPNAHQKIALCPCNNKTLSSTEAPLKKTQPAQQGPYGRSVTPPRPRLVEFPVIPVNTRKLFEAHG